MRRWPLIAAGLALLGAGTIAFGFRGNTGLTGVHASIATDHASVSHLEPDDFTKLSDDEFIVFDVREPAEFAVSHLPGAVQLDPAVTPAEFEARFGEQLGGKRAVFYCSVGRRSSIAAERLQPVLSARGARGSNLSRGIFGWRNEERPLVSAAGPTDRVHPYDDVWGRLIEDETAISYGAGD